MTAPLITPDIEHLNHEPVCGSGWHLEIRPPASWWLSGHGCGDAFWCDTCIQRVRDMIAVVGPGRCTDCHLEFQVATVFFGEMRPL